MKTMIKGLCPVDIKTFDEILAKIQLIIHKLLGGKITMESRPQNRNWKSCCVLSRSPTEQLENVNMTFFICNTVQSSLGRVRDTNKWFLFTLAGCIDQKPQIPTCYLIYTTG